MRNSPAAKGTQARSHEPCAASPRLNAANQRLIKATRARTNELLVGDQLVGLLDLVHGPEVEQDIKEEEGVDRPIEGVYADLEVLRTSAARGTVAYA